MNQEPNRRVAVVLFNLGGPDSPDAVRPFLYNLFNDPAIIAAPTPVRWALAKFISWRRAPFARQNYDLMGGSSPLLPNTVKQADALQAALAQDGEVRCFIAMRYWHPFSAETAKDVKAFQPDLVILLPLYPQFAAATSGSSVKDWHRAAAAAELNAPEHTICCYPREAGLVLAMAESTAAAWRRAAEAGEPRILFSAHGLPKREIARGDPYQWQVEQTATDIVSGLEGKLDKTPDWLVSYQSRVGPLEWIGPYTDAEIERAGREGRPLVVVPVSFVSEHVETLVELDIEYRELAEEKGVPAYERVATVGEDAGFIEGLAGMVRQAMREAAGTACGQGGCICPADRSRCPCLGQQAEEG
jgi:ferrochelatase